MTSDRISLRHRLEHLGVRLAFHCAGRLPFQSLRSIAQIFGSTVWAVDPRGRKVSLANLEAAFGSRFTEQERRSIGKKSYAAFARTMLELGWAPNMSREVIANLVDFEGLEHTPCHFDPKSPAIYVSIHYANFEWLGLTGAYVAGNGPLIAQQFKNPLIGPIFDRLRQSTGNPIYLRERAMIRLLNALRQGGKIGFLVDLSLDPLMGTVAIDQFGGLKTSVTQMHAALALRTGAKLIPLECRPAPQGRYRLIYHPPLAFDKETPVQEIVQMTWNALEPAIHEAPENWLWAYKHWRFRPSSGDTSRYPFYSNPAKRFDRLLAGKPIRALPRSGKAG